MSEASEDVPIFPPFPPDNLFRLQIAHSVQDVALALDLNIEKFFYVVQHADDGSYYRTFKIPKKREGYRLISAPKRGLGLAQTKLANVLKQHYKPKPCVKGYVANESFLTNARYHERQKWILNIDIKDFYPSITFPRVRGMFLSSYFQFNPRVATILARITTTPDGLPQGARTSPIIANMITSNLDRKLLEIASKNRLKYTRYADDITFSSSQKSIPLDLVRSWEPEFGNRKVKLGRAVIDAFKSSSFEINEEKTRIAMNYERQEVTGLIVNRSANIWRKDISRLRMILYSAKKHGAESAAKVWIGPEKTAANFWEFIIGWLSFVSQVRGKNDVVLAKLCKMAVLAGLTGPEWITRNADMVRRFDVFLSHASEDKPKVRKLKDRLESLGVLVFFDEDSISWGDSIVEKINHGLLMSNFFVPYLSQTFSNKGWTNKELNSAIAANIGRKGRILPIKDKNFSIGENYPLLVDTLYKEWPDGDDDAFIQEISDQILARVELEKSKSHDLD